MGMGNGEWVASIPNSQFPGPTLARLLFIQATPMNAALLALLMSLSGDSPVEQLTNELKSIGSRIDQVALVRTLSLTRDAARFTLKDGVLYLLGPVGHRKVAAVFVGNGAVELYPPLAVERGEMH